MELDLGTKFTVNLHDLSENKAGYTIQQLNKGMKDTTELTVLNVDFKSLVPTDQNKRFVVNPFCRTFFKLRRHNENHPLLELKILNANLVQQGMSSVLQQFLIAAKQFGVVRVYFVCVDDVPFHLLAMFCRDNNSLKDLALYNVSLSAIGTMMPLPSNDKSQDSAGFLSLNMLHLQGLWFRNSTAATNFANMLAHMSVDSLVLGKITALNTIDGDGDDIAQTIRIVAKFMWPKARLLTLLDTCHLDHVKTALEDGKTSVKGLLVWIDCLEYNIDENVAAKLHRLASFFHHTEKLLAIELLTNVNPPTNFFHSMAACATVLDFQMHSGSRILEQQLPDDKRLREQHLKEIYARGSEITTRNFVLARMVANPSNYSVFSMLNFMRLFTNCPRGLLMVASCLLHKVSCVLGLTTFAFTVRYCGIGWTLVEWWCVQWAL